MNRRERRKKNSGRAATGTAGTSGAKGMQAAAIAPPPARTWRLRAGIWVVVIAALGSIGAYFGSKHFSARNATPVAAVIEGDGVKGPKGMLWVPGGMVFTGTDRPVNFDDYSQWWTYAPGTDWRHPQGPKSSIEGKDDHPVVQVS